MNVPSMSLRIGQRLGPYRIEGLLGAGGMGHVYLALDTRLHRTVAIKVPLGTPQTQDAIWQEARLAAALNHPSICVVHEVGECDEMPFLVMEHIRGMALSLLLETEGALAADVSVRFATQVADALAHAHDRGVVHGDIKSSNVMIDAEGRVKVLDFGVGVWRAAQTSDDATTNPTPCNSGAGTVPYMAPELLRGDIPGVHSDVWALGVLLFEMLTGARPFRGTTPYETAAQILGNERMPCAVRVPRRLSGVIDRCLCSRPEDRFPSARDFADTLRLLHPAFRAREKSAVWTSTRFATALS
jgi:serine/threonine protein kinase